MTAREYQELKALFAVLPDVGADERGRVPWRKVSPVLVINRLCDPGSEFAVHCV